MRQSITVVINTFNEQKNIGKAIKSVSWADEVLVCDMYSQDKTVEIAKKLGAKIFYHKKEDFVEPARNFAVSKATSEWVLILDPDEEITPTLAERLKEISQDLKQIDYVKIPRKNLIFGKWMQGAMWWPDLNIRFFKKGKVLWSDKIHRPPQTSGMGIDLEADGKWAITHHNYQTISQFLERLNRYTAIEAQELVKQGYKFNWTDLIQKPLGEFLSRFFANKGYIDGIHGLALSLLQAFSFLVVNLKVWEKSGFHEQGINVSRIEEEKEKSAYEINYWFKKTKTSGNLFKRFFSKF